MTLTRARNSAIAVVISLVAGTAPVAQQQAAEAPAATRAFYTRPAVAALNGMVTTGHPIASSGWGSIGHMQTIKIDPVTGTITAGGDPRRTGYAIGY